jgi:hypothetical protein
MRLYRYENGETVYYRILYSRMGYLMLYSEIDGIPRKISERDLLKEWLVEHNENTKMS